jgi:ABC-type uncharacterized transport system permease subunit
VPDIDAAIWPLLATLALVPLTVVAWAGRGEQHDARLWPALTLAMAGVGAWAVAQQAGQWRTGISVALWLSIAISLGLFVVVCLMTRVAQRLAPLLAAYLLILAVLALAWRNEPMRPLSGLAPPPWLIAHVALSVIAYSLLTLAAVASAAVTIRERALKAKWSWRFVRSLPAVAEGEALQLRLLIAAALLLVAAVVTGMAITWLEYGVPFRLDHKSILSIGGLLLTVGLVALRQRKAISVRRVAHYILVAYLLVTLAYPGVKFVTDVLIG